MDPFYRNSLFMALSSVFSAGCGFFFWMIAAKIYTIEEVGLASALISFLGLILLFSRFGFDFAVIRFLSSEDKATVFSTSLIITTTASILVGSIFILLVDVLAPALVFLEDPGHVLIFLFIAAVNSVAAITGNVFVADRKADHYFFQNIFMALRIPFLVPLAFLGTVGIFCSLGLSFLVASFFGIIILRRSFCVIGSEHSMDFVRRSFKFSYWNYASNILSIAPVLILPVMILNMLGEGEVAKYSIAFAIGNVVLIIPNSLGTSLFVEGSHGEELKKSAIRALIASFVLLVPAVLLVFIFGGSLLELLSEEYLEAFGLLRVLAVSSFLVMVYSLFVPIQNVRMKVGSIVKLNVVRCILLLGLSYAFIQDYGIIGVGYGWAVSYSVVVVIIVMILKYQAS